MKNYASEKEFLKHYNIHDYDLPLATVDLCIFTLEEEALKVLLVKRGDYPGKGRWALPGGFVDARQDQDLQATALRKLAEKTGVRTPYVEQIETIGNATRDPRGWSLTVLYFALVAHSETLAQTDAGEAVKAVEAVQWVAVPEALQRDLAFDHRRLLEKAVERLRSKVSYTTLPVHILPREFTLAELQNAYEVIMDREVDKKAFRRRIDAADLLAETGKSRQDGGRPAKLYRLRKGAEMHFYTRSI
jgi:ADP-ribose pyrophosphatase YjhB (NUDIX family)